MLAEVVKIKLAGTYAAIGYKLKLEIYSSYTIARVISFVLFL